MTLYLNGKKYNCNINGQQRVIKINIALNESVEPNYISTVTINDDILATTNGLFLQVREE